LKQIDNERLLKYLERGIVAQILELIAVKIVNVVAFITRIILDNRGTRNSSSFFCLCTVINNICVFIYPMILLVNGLIKEVLKMSKLNTSIFVLKVMDDGEVFEYEYGNYTHAKEQYDNEKVATIYEYVNGNYHYVESKM